MFSIVTKMNNSSGVGYLYLLLGGLMIIGGLYLTKSTLEFVGNALSTEGVVIESVQKGEHLYPRIKFQDHNGKSHIIDASPGCRPACYRDLERVNILYRPDVVMDAQIDSFMGLWLSGVGVFSVGASFVIISLFQLKRLKRKPV
jgi:hypothetical protein